MAFALKGTGSASTANSTTANQASLIVTTATTAGAAGDLAVLLYAVDNNQTTDGDEVAVTSVVDSAGNKWVKAVEFTNGQGTAQTGAVCGLWYSNLNVALPTGGTVTLTFSNAASRDASAASLTYYTKAAGFDASLAGVPGTLANDAAAAGSLNVTTANIACLRVRGIASESSTVTALTPTATFAIVTQAVAVIAAATSMGIRGEWVINTGTGTASAPTAGAGAVDNASVYAAFTEVPTRIPTEWSIPRILKKTMGVALIAASGLSAPVFTPSVIDMDWFQPMSDPVRRIRAPNKVNLFPFTAATTSQATDDFDWFGQLSGPRQTRRGLATYLHDHTTDVYQPAEVVTVDKWFDALSEPVRRIRAPNKVNLFPFTAASTTEDVTVDKWFDALSEPTRTKISVTAAPDQTWVPIVTAEVITVDKWLSSWAEPPRIASTIFPNQSYMPLVAEVVTADKWFDALSEPARGDRFNVALQPSYTTEYFPDAPNANAGQWFGSFSEPVRVKSRFSALYQAYTTEYFPDTFTNWFTPLSEPIRERGFRATDQSSVPYLATEIVTVDKWFDPLSEPVRTKPGLRTALQPVSTQDTVFIPDPSGYLEGWYSGLSEPVRQKAGLRAAQQPDLSEWPLTTPEVVTVDKWYAALSLPVRQKLGLLAATQSAYTTGYFSFEVVSVDKWYASLSEPKRFRSGLHASLQQTITQDTVFIPNPSQYGGWYGALSEPPRQRGLKAAHQVPNYNSYVVVAAEIVTVDKWFRQLGDPTRRKPEDRDRYKGENEWTAIAASMKWFRPLAEPWRTKPGLTAAVRQSALTLPAQTFTPSVAGWWRPLDDPPKAKAGLRTANQRFDTRSTVFIPNPNQFLEGWFDWWSEPVRLKIGIRPGLQQFLSSTPRLLPSVITGTMSALETKDVFLSGGRIWNRASSAEIGIVDTNKFAAEIGISRAVATTAAIASVRISIQIV